MPQDGNGHYFFGNVKVGEKGQIVIPKEAREVFGIKPGDSLVVLGDVDNGLGLCTMERFLPFASSVMKQLRKDDTNESD